MQYSEKKQLNELLEFEMEKLRVLTEKYVDKDQSIRLMEWGYLKQVLGICLNLLKFVIRLKIAQKRGVYPIGQEHEQITNKGKRSRNYLSLFGLIEFSRPSFHSPERGMLYVVDEALDMPRGLWSYNLQELTSSTASYVNFRESVKTINSILNLGLSDVGSQRNVNNLGAEVEKYYEQKPISRPVGPVCFSASFDGKGVPKIKPLDKNEPKQLKRLGKGKKRGIKQMATVGVISYFEPKKREVSSIIKGLMEYGGKNKEVTTAASRENRTEPLEKVEKLENDNRWHQDIHRRAFLADQNKSIDYGISRIKSMINHPKSRFVVPIDAGIGLEDKVMKSIKEHDLMDRFDGIILDIIHVSEYVWDCANAVLGEGSKLRTDWVRKKLEDLLNSKTTKVIDDLIQLRDSGNFSKSKNEKLQKAITYFSNHQHKMNYKTYIQKGYPVSSALVEANCKHLVKDRMELSGMRWSSDGAQNMMDIRAVKLNGDLADFINFLQQNNRKIDLAIAA